MFLALCSWKLSAAIPALQQECVFRRANFGKLGFQIPRFTGKHQRRAFGKLRFGGGKFPLHPGSSESARKASAASFRVTRTRP